MPFRAAFGGSFLNHQWLIAARSPSWESATAPESRDANADPLSGAFDFSQMP